MSVPQTKTYLVALCCLFSTFLIAQNQGLSAIPTGVYFSAKSTIAEKTATSEHYRTLFAAVQAADLEDVLDMKGPFTFFAPSESAFNKLSRTELLDLFKEENKSKLKAILTYHLVAGNYSASNILKAMCRGGGQASFTTIHGNKIIATMSGLDIILTDNLGNRAIITNADATQSNGVIHQIDKVIRPSR